MQKSVKDGIISVQDIHNKGFKLIIASLLLLLVILGGVGVILFQSPLRESQDPRRDASVEDGQVLVTTSTTPDPLRVETTSSIDLMVNTQGLQTTGIQLVFNVITDTIDTPQLELESNTGLQLLSSEVEQTTDGYLISMAAVPQQITDTFATNNPVTVARLTFTPHQTGSLTLAFDSESSKSHYLDLNSGTVVDELKTIPPATFQVQGDATLPACVYTYSAWSSCVNNQQTRTVTGKSPETCQGEPQVVQSCESTTTKTSVNWTTSDVSLVADDFYIIANGQKFSQPIQNFKIQSDPAESDSETHTTLETTWQENGVEMRLFMYFKHDGTDWWSNELRIYNGTQAGGWIYFTQGNSGTVANQKANGYFTTKLGDRYNRSGVVTYTTSTGGSGELHFENLRLQAFRKHGVGGYSSATCNIQCGSNADCGVNQRCYLNRCRLVTNVSSETCTAPADAGLSRQCNEYCADSRECANGYSCYFNRCRRANNPDSQSCAQLSITGQQQMAASCNQNCTSNADCATNLRCESGKCRLATNPSSTTCSVATSSTVSQTTYGNKGGSTTTSDNRPAASVKPAPTASGSGIVASPTVQPTSTPIPSSPPLVAPEPEASSLEGIINLLNSRGLSLPIILGAVGALILLLLLLILISRLLGRKKQPPTPPTPVVPKDTPQIKNIEQRINQLQQQKNVPLPGAPAAPLPITPISRPATPPAPQPAAPAPRPATPAPQPVTAPQPTSAPKPSAPLPVAQVPTTPLLAEADELELPAHTSSPAGASTASKSDNSSTTPPPAPQPTTEKHHSTMMSRIRAKGLIKDTSSTEIFNSQKRDKV